MNITVPIDRGVALFRILLDAGMIIGEAPRGAPD
jgi:hypothetical protein